METSLDDPFPTVLLSMMAEMPISFFLINGVVILVLLGLSGLVSGSEVAFFSFSHNQIKEFNASIDIYEKRISHLLHHPKRLLATILILNNLINIFIVTISTFATWQIVGEDGKQGLTIVILTTIITLLIIFFGEIIPKVYANHNGTAFAKLTSGLLMLSYRFFKPISWFLM
ncbi:MAG: CNNM domain-containing protein, partial [Ekhidna sp.]